MSSTNSSKAKLNALEAIKNYRVSELQVRSEEILNRMNDRFFRLYSNRPMSLARDLNVIFSNVVKYSLTQVSLLN